VWCVQVTEEMKTNIGFRLVTTVMIAESGRGRYMIGVVVELIVDG